MCWRQRSSVGRSQTAQLLTQFLEGHQILGDIVLLQQRFGLKAGEAKRLGELELRELLLAVQLDHGRFFGGLIEIAEPAPKRFLELVGKLESYHKATMGNL